jgi:superkiller protein 3
VQERHPSDFWLNHELGWALQAQKPARLEEAARYFTAAVALRPSSPIVLVNLSVALADKGDQEGAIRACRRALELDPRFAWAHNNLGAIFCDYKRDYDRAIACFRLAIALDPKDARFHSNLGNALREKGERDAAIRAYHRAIELDPKLANTHLNLGVALYRKRDREWAIVEYRRAIELDPKLALAHSNLGAALREKGERDAAIRACKRAIELDPKLAQAHSNLGVALYAKGQREEAIQEYRTAIQLDPKDANAHNNLGLALAAKGEREEAIQEYRTAIALDPKLALAYSNLGNVLCAKGELDAAIRTCKRAIELDPKLAQAHSNLGAALAVKGEWAGARRAFRRAIELDPKLTQAHLGLGMALLQQGQFREAKAELRTALDLLPQPHPLRKIVTQLLRQCEQMLALETRLPAILQGDAKPKDAADMLALAELCRIKNRYTAGARFYADAFTAEPKLAGDLKAQHRYNASRCAALATIGQGKDADKLDDRGERARWRQQALDWLRDDLTAYGKLLEGGKPEDRALVRQRLQHWKQDRDLAGLRDKDAVAKLSEDEQKTCKQLWAGVETMLQKAKEPAR